VQTDRSIPNIKPDIIIWDNEKGTCMLIDVGFQETETCSLQKNKQIFQTEFLTRQTIIIWTPAGIRLMFLRTQMEFTKYQHWFRQLYCKGCPTRYRTRHFFNNSNTNECIATKFEEGYVRCVRNEEECVCSACL
jgi:hypothetical protein